MDRKFGNSQIEFQSYAWNRIIPTKKTAPNHYLKKKYEQMRDKLKIRGNWWEMY